MISHIIRTIERFSTEEPNVELEIIEHHVPTFFDTSDDVYRIEISKKGTSIIETRRWVKTNIRLKNHIKKYQENHKLYG